MIKRVIVNAILLLIICTLQYTNLIRVISIKSAIPDLIFIFTILTGVFINPIYAMFLGFSGGLLLDIFGESLIGFNALIYSAIGYLTFIPKKRIDIDNTILLIIYSFVYLIFKAILFLIISSIFLNKTDILLYFKNIFVIEFFYTLVISIPIFHIYKIIFKKKKSY